MVIEFILVFVEFVVEILHRTDNDTFLPGVSADRVRLSTPSSLFVSLLRDRTMGKAHAIGEYCRIVSIQHTSQHWFRRTFENHTLRSLLVQDLIKHISFISLCSS